MPGALRLQAVSRVALVGGLGKTVIENVADIVAWREEQAGIAPKCRDLIVQRPCGMQIAENAVMGDLALTFVEIFRWETRHAIGLQHEIAAASILRSQTDNAIQPRGLQPDLVG